MFFFCLFQTCSMYPFMCLSYAGCRLLSRIMSSRVFLAFKANNAVMIYAVPLVGNGLVAQRTIVDLLYDVSFCPLSRTLIQFVQSCYSPPQPSALPKGVWNGSITNRSIIPEDIVFIFFVFLLLCYFLCISSSENLHISFLFSFFVLTQAKKQASIRRMLSFYDKNIRKCRYPIIENAEWVYLRKGIGLCWRRDKEKRPGV